MNQELWSYALPDGRVIRVVHGDITREEVDAIVNAANERLAHGGGVAGAIVRRGGYRIQEESNAWVREHGPVRTGTAAITGAGELPCRYVIHAVGPVWRNRGDEPELLASAVRSALDLASQYSLARISMPGISSGIFGFPKPLCAKVMWDTVLRYFAEHPESSVKEVRFCNIDRLTADLFLKEGQRRAAEASAR